MYVHLYVPAVHHSGLVAAMIISLIFIVLLRFLAGVMVWVMIVMVILLIGYGTFPKSLLYLDMLFGGG